jgi:hypothetical protein
MSDDEGVWGRMAKAADASTSSEMVEPKPLHACALSMWGAPLPPNPRYNSRKDRATTDIEEVDIASVGEDEPHPLDKNYVSTAPPLPYRNLPPDEDFAEKVVQGQLVLRVVEANDTCGLMLEIVKLGTMIFSDFMSYKEELNKCNPRFY